MIASLTVATPIGPMRLGARGDVLCGVWLPNRYEACADTPSAVLGEAARQLRAYFAGTLQVFDLPLEAEGTAFQRSVWRALAAIPYGVTRSYLDVARTLGSPTATRAVGAANGKNPHPIVVPCHRVIGANGTLTGFGGGLPAKRWLLAHEARVAGKQTSLAI